MRLIPVLLALFLSFPLFSANFQVYFWNLDARELALSGSVGAREGWSWVLAGNPATLPLSPEGGKPERVLSFPNALRMATLLVRETGALPYDAITTEERLQESKSHAKWMGLSLLSLYRFLYKFPNFSVAFSPMREYPVRGKATIFSSTIALNFGIFDLVRVGASGTWYYALGTAAWNPFRLSDLDTSEEHGFGGSAGLMLNLGRVQLGLDYQYRPDSLFRGLDDRGLPVRDDSLSLSLGWNISTTLDISLDLPNWHNSGHKDFLLPRAGATWTFHKLEAGQAALLGGAFFDRYGRFFCSAGASVTVKWSSFLFRGAIAGIFDLESGSANSLTISLDFFM